MVSRVSAGTPQDPAHGLLQVFTVSRSKNDPYLPHSATASVRTCLPTYTYSYHPTHRALNRTQPQIQIQNNQQTKGIVGVLLEPYYGLRADGPRGLLAGLVRGSLGLALRPFYGFLASSSSALDAAAYMLLPGHTAALRLEQKLKLRRERSPRFFRQEDLNRPLAIYRRVR